MAPMARLVPERMTDRQLHATLMRYLVEIESYGLSNIRASEVRARASAARAIALEQHQRGVQLGLGLGELRQREQVPRQQH
jgi:hypothetical protein